MMSKLKELLRTEALFRDSLLGYREHPVALAFQDPDLFPVYLDLLQYGPWSPLTDIIMEHFRAQRILNPEQFAPLIAFLAREHEHSMFDASVYTNYENQALHLALILEAPYLPLREEGGFLMADHEAVEPPTFYNAWLIYKEAMLQENPNIPEHFLRRLQRCYRHIAWELVENGSSR